VAIQRLRREDRSASAATGDVDVVLSRIQGRYLVGASSLTPGPLLQAQGATLFNQGSIVQRLRFAALSAELAGPDVARGVVETTASLVQDERAEAGFAPSADEEALLRVMSELYAPLPPDREWSDVARARIAALDPVDRAIVVDRLDWPGRLALAPAGAAPGGRTPPSDAAAEAERDAVMGAATRTFVAVIALFSGAALLGLGGLVGLIILIVLAARGTVRSRLGPVTEHSGVYAETFAVWMVMYLAGSAGAAALAGTADLGYLPHLGAFAVSLVALAWPVVRGIPWRRVRQDIGWTNPGAVVEPAMGIAGYAMALPLLAIGVGMTFGLLTLQQALGPAPAPLEPVGGPAHPIVAELGSGDGAMILQVLLLGAIAAPIVEETMFRGVLYRHLRGLTHRFGPAPSMIGSALLNGLVFAIVHPQELVAVPALASLAFAFCIVREWRGSLIPAIVMHGISNGIVLSFVALAAAP
jgi:membrane protease YdiL (CAAX protease family)